MKLLRLTFLLVMILFVVSRAQAQSCDCNITPYRPDPPCFSVCTARLLANVNVDQLVRIVRLREELARRIASWQGRKNAQRFEDYREILTQSELREVGTRMNSLTPAEIQALREDRGDPFGGLTRQNRAETSSDLQRIMETQSAAEKAAAEEAAITYSYYEDAKGEWRWRIVDGRGHVLAESKDAYKTEGACISDIMRVRNAKDAPLKRQ